MCPRARCYAVYLLVTDNRQSRKFGSDWQLVLSIPKEMGANTDTCWDFGAPTITILVEDRLP